MEPETACTIISVDRDPS